MQFEAETTTPNEADRPLAPIDPVVFLAELALLAVLAVAGARLGHGVAESVVLALVLPIAAAVLWSRTLAPRARARLRGLPRLALKVALVAAAAALLAVSGALDWAVAFGIGTGAIFVVGERGAVSDR